MKSVKNSNETIGYRTRDLPAFSAVPQPTTCKMMWTVSYVMLLNFTYKHLIWLIMIGYLIWPTTDFTCLSYCKYTGLGVREIKRFIDYRQYKTKYRQKDLFSEEKKLTTALWVSEWEKLSYWCQNYLEIVKIIPVFLHLWNSGTASNTQNKCA